VGYRSQCIHVRVHVGTILANALQRGDMLSQLGYTAEFHAEVSSLQTLIIWLPTISEGIPVPTGLPVPYPYLRVRSDPYHLQCFR